MKSASAFVALLTAATLASPLGAQQSERTVTAERQRVAVDTLHVRMLYGAGKVRVGAAPQSLLYDLHVRFDPARTRETHRYDAATHTLTVGSDSAVARIFSLGQRSFHTHTDDHGQGSDLTLGVPTGIPLDLDLQFGATEATLDFTGLTVSRLRLNVAASAATLTFGTVNPVELSDLELRTGAAGLEVRKLGNARAKVVHVNSGVGSVTLDLAGDWTGRMTLDVHSVLGQITIRVPRDVGVQAHVSKLLGGFDKSGFTEKDGAYYSANWDAARRTVVVDGDVTMAALKVSYQ